MKAWLVALVVGAQEPAPAPPNEIPAAPAQAPQEPATVPEQAIQEPAPQPSEAPQEPPGPGPIVIEADGMRIERAGPIEVRSPAIEDADGDGVVRISQPDLTLDFGGARLHGAPSGRAPDAYTGVGIVVEAPRVTLRNARVSGFKVGILARGAHGLVLEDCDVSDNYRQRLRSTPEAEDASDWLSPHANDGREWRTSHGAGICVEDSSGVTVRRCRARGVQNGLILDRASAALVYDNDFSFLSGWGIALWRSSGNTISRNALDFCVRGYSHGVYNHGQDSAGLLLFEQSSGNLIAENSITHGGDGIFAFAGREALGEAPGPEGFDPAGKGCNENLITGNDLSYAAAHGLELTFSFGNVVTGNRFAENAICGLWGGYSQRTTILANEFLHNGQAGYGLERGGVNIEHSKHNALLANRFEGNACGVHLWWDADESLLATPWAQRNGGECASNVIASNTFVGDAIGLHLAECSATQAVDNRFENVPTEVQGSAPDGQGLLAELLRDFGPTWRALERRGQSPLGAARPVGARPELAGRDKILLTEWGPHDGQSPYLQRVSGRGASQVWRWLGNEALDDVVAEGEVELDRQPGPPPEVAVRSPVEGALVPYTLVARSAAGEQRRSGLLSTVRWNVRVFPWTVDPRQDEAGWRAESAAATSFEVFQLDLTYGSGGASQLAGLPETVAAAALPADGFGTLAEARVRLPAGRWKLTVTSDDGVRVKVDGESVLEDWTLHPPKSGSAVIDGDRVALIEVEHFEVDGFAVLQLAIDAAE